MADIHMTIHNGIVITVMEVAIRSFYGLGSSTALGKLRTTEARTRMGQLPEIKLITNEQRSHCW